MDKKIPHKRKEKAIELRSEKVRNIIGQIPPSLLRYGNLIIGGVLVLLIIISSFLPYRLVLSGTAMIGTIPKEQTDSVFVSVLLKFPEGKTTINATNCKITIITPELEILGRVVEYRTIRTVKGENKAQLYLPNKEIKKVDSSEVDFRLTLIETTLLKRFLGS